MRRVTELHVRGDWGLVRLIYVPALAVAFLMIKWLPFLAVASIRINPCFLCWLVSRWGNQVEEYYNAKPILKITDGGIVHEDGGEPTEYGWSEITSVVMHRRNNIPPWRTNGSTEVTPPYWLAISLRDPDYKADDGAVFSEGDSYAERSRRPDGGREIDTEGARTICIWPRQVVGGLFSLMRFAKELQRCLIAVCEQGTIPCLVPAAAEG